MDAQKRLTLDANPAVLAVQLKRFDFLGSYGSKINRYIRFPETLDVSPFMSRGKVSEKYRLYGVLVHSGGSCHSGHYYCFVKGSNGIWYCMNDSDVQQVSLKTVLQQSAYMLFYVRDAPARPLKTQVSLVSPSPIKASPVPTKAEITVKRKEHIIQREYMTTPPLSPLPLKAGIKEASVQKTDKVATPVVVQNGVPKKTEQTKVVPSKQHSPKQKQESNVQISAASLLDDFMDLSSKKKVSRNTMADSPPPSPKPQLVALSPQTDKGVVVKPAKTPPTIVPSMKKSTVVNATDAWIVETFAALDKTPSLGSRKPKTTTQKPWTVQESPSVKRGGETEHNESQGRVEETKPAHSYGDRTASLFLNNGPTGMLCYLSIE